MDAMEKMKMHLKMHLLGTSRLAIWRARAFGVLKIHATFESDVLIGYQPASIAYLRIAATLNLIQRYGACRARLEGISSISI